MKAALTLLRGAMMPPSSPTESMAVGTVVPSGAKLSSQDEWHLELALPRPFEVRVATSDGSAAYFVQCVEGSTVGKVLREFQLKASDIDEIDVHGKVVQQCTLLASVAWRDRSSPTLRVTRRQWRGPCGDQGQAQTMPPRAEQPVRNIVQLPAADVAQIQQALERPQRFFFEIVIFHADGLTKLKVHNDVTIGEVCSKVQLKPSDFEERDVLDNPLRTDTRIMSVAFAPGPTKALHHQVVADLTPIQMPLHLLQSALGSFLCSDAVKFKPSDAASVEAALIAEGIDDEEQLRVLTRDACGDDEAKLKECLKELGIVKLGWRMKLVKALRSPAPAAEATSPYTTPPRDAASKHFEPHCSPSNLSSNVDGPPRAAPIFINPHPNITAEKLTFEYIEAATDEDHLRKMSETLASGCFGEERLELSAAVEKRKAAVSMLHPPLLEGERHSPIKMLPQRLQQKLWESGDAIGTYIEPGFLDEHPELFIDPHFAEGFLRLMVKCIPHLNSEDGDTMVLLTNAPHKGVWLCADKASSSRDDVRQAAQTIESLNFIIEKYPVRIDMGDELREQTGGCNDHIELRDRGHWVQMALCSDIGPADRETDTLAQCKSLRLGEGSSDYEPSDTVGLRVISSYIATQRMKARAQSAARAAGQLSVVELRQSTESREYEVLVPVPDVANSMEPTLRDLHNFLRATRGGSTLNASHDVRFKATSPPAEAAIAIRGSRKAVYRAFKTLPSLLQLKGPRGMIKQNIERYDLPLAGKQHVIDTVVGFRAQGVAPDQHGDAVQISPVVFTCDHSGDGETCYVKVIVCGFHKEAMERAVKACKECFDFFVKEVFDVHAQLKILGEPADSAWQHFCRAREQFGKGSFDSFKRLHHVSVVAEEAKMTFTLCGRQDNVNDVNEELRCYLTGRQSVHKEVLFPSIKIQAMLLPPLNRERLELLCQQLRVDGTQMNFLTHSLSALGLDLTTASVEFPPASGDCFCSVTGEQLSVGNIPDLVRELLETESRRVEMHNIELSNVQKLALLSNGAPAMVHVARSFGVFATAANELVAGGGVPLSGPAAYSEKTRRKVAKRATKSHTGKAKCLSQVTLKGSKGCVIEVVEGDIVENNGVECIVNPANEDLNNGGGAARVISQASGGAGGEFERACRIFIRSKRRLATGTAFVTHKTGMLKRKGIKTICNAVGPIYQGGNSDEEIVLMKTFYAVLQEAQASGVKSIAIPPISLGIFSIPEKLVFRAMIVATLCWAATDGKRGCLKKIQFISNQKRVGNESTARDIATWLEEALDTRSFDKANARAASVERESDFATAQAQWYFEVYNHELSSDRTTVKMHGKRWQKFEPDQCGKIDDTYLDMKSTDPGSHTGATANMVDFSGEKRVVDVKEGGIVNIVQTGNRYSIVFDEAAGFENAPSMLSNLKKAYGYRSSRAMYQYNKRTHSSREVIRIEKASREATLDCAFADAREASEGATFGGAVRSWARWAIGSTSRGPANLDELLRGVTPATYTKRFGDGSSAASPETATARDAADAMPSCDTMNADSDCDTKLLSGTQLQLAGLPQCLERTSVYLKRWLNDALITKEMLLGTKNAVIRQALEDALEGIQHDHGVSIEMTDDKLIISGYRFAHSASDAIVDGPQEALSQLKEVRMEAIEDAWVDTSASLVEAKRLKYPLEWECRTLDHPQQPEVQESRFIKINTTDKKSTVRGMCEYTRIKKKLRADVPAATNIKIHIFQDKQKWCGFEAKKLEIKAKNGGADPVVMDLWHGTGRAGEPKAIIQSQFGLDFRHSGGGLWGTALYLAKTPGYSNNGYAFTDDSTGRHSLLLCKAIAGKVVHVRHSSSAGKIYANGPHDEDGARQDCKVDGVLPEEVSFPLPRSISKDKSSTGLFVPPKFADGSQADCVQGLTGSPEAAVFMFYAHHQVYPMYLVSYDTSDS